MVTALDGGCTLRKGMKRVERDIMGRKVIIVGGGFGGLELARSLKNSPFEILLIDRHNYHTFQPLLYQVSTAGLEPESVATAFRDIFKRQKNFRFRMADVLRIDRKSKTLQTTTGSFSYDILVLATGSRSNFFGVPGVQEHALPMKSIPEALTLRHRILGNLERALSEKDETVRQQLMNVVISGGGPTGVELAGALGELKKKIFPLDYPELDISRWNIYLVDMMDRLLPGMSAEASRTAEKTLKEFGVRIRLKTKIESYDGKAVSVSGDEKIPASVLIWSAGVQGYVPEGILPEEMHKGRVRVDAFNRLENDSAVYVIGDAAAQMHESPAGYPMLAPVAMQQARRLAQNLQRMEKGEKPQPFHYHSQGVMATIGRNHAVVDLSWIKFNGFPAWLVWLFVHLMALVGFRNKLIAFVNWGWSYLTYNRGLRLILSEEEKR